MDLNVGAHGRGMKVGSKGRNELAKKNSEEDKTRQDSQ